MINKYVKFEIENLIDVVDIFEYITHSILNMIVEISKLDIFHFVLNLKSF